MAVSTGSTESSTVTDQIEINDYVSYRKLVDGRGYLSGAGYVSQVSFHHAVIDGKIHLYREKGDNMYLVAKQQRLLEDDERLSGTTWGPIWGIVPDTA